ncbi:MAG: hypothetical protein RBG13Loki_0626 [Promethearchaeota archaeon CR_4]|nr:MAG: hypothetical protein RBG13Loki_0626 [Candidatus Lokiarchaeota archaeon CR_4]
MRKELVLEGAGPQLEEWRENFVEKVTVEMPKAITLPMEHTILVARRGQRVWTSLNKRKPSDVHLVSVTRSALIWGAIIFFAIGCFFLLVYGIILITYYSYMYSYPYGYGYSGYYYSLLISLIIILIIFWVPAGILAGFNKTRFMQTKVLQIARETWFSMTNIPKFSLYAQPDKKLVTEGVFCANCGGRQEIPGAKFCQHCGKSYSV